jgi:hypothetical protein
MLTRQASRAFADLRDPATVKGVLICKDNCRKLLEKVLWQLLRCDAELPTVVINMM